MKAKEIGAQIRAACASDLVSQAATLALEAAAELERLSDKLEEVRKAKLLIDDIEGEIDRQTHDQHREGANAELGMPDDAELHIVITAADERKLGKAATMLTQAVTGL